MRVTVVYSPQPRQTREWLLDVDPGTTVQEAVGAAGIAALLAQGGADPPSVGIWGRQVVPGRVLAENDRVEIYRPLTVDPKVARRERFRAQGARATGLFARQRAGGKSGY